MNIYKINTEALHFSEEDFFLFCQQNKELRIERDKNKQIWIMAPTGGETGKYNLSIASRLWLWNEQHKKGYAFDSSTGFTLAGDAMRSPDAAWIEKSRWEQLTIKDRERFAHICPDFIIELKSESDSLKNIKEKMEEWMQNGCRLGWLIDRYEETVFIYKPSQEVQIIKNFNKKLSGEDVLPGFELDLYEIL